jgi:hypothetical protein
VLARGDDLRHDPEDPDRREDQRQDPEQPE